MIGLRTFLKDFAKTTELASFDSLYERQRELVRCGLLHSVEGRGPGSGVPLNAETLATFLIGVLASDKLSDLGKRTEALINARPALSGKDGKNPRLGKSNFHHAVVRALLQERKLGHRSPRDVFLGIQATRPWRGTILLDRPTATHGHETVEYYVNPEAPLKLTFTMQNVSIEGAVFSWISQRLWEYLEHYYDLKPKRG